MCVSFISLKGILKGIMVSNITRSCPSTSTLNLRNTRLSNFNPRVWLSQRKDSFGAFPMYHLCYRSYVIFPWIWMLLENLGHIHLCLFLVPEFLIWFYRLSNEWNSIPVKMTQTDSRYYKKKQRWRCCCFCGWPWLFCCSRFAYYVYLKPHLLWDANNFLLLVNQNRS